MNFQGKPDREHIDHPSDDGDDDDDDPVHRLFSQAACPIDPL